jgi:hypothetical protein
MYGRYFQKANSKWSPRERLLWKYYPVPGCRSHSEIVGDRRAEILFDHFSKRPQASHGLYWRTHISEYNTLMESINS